MCMARGWLVNRLDAHNQIDIHIRSEEYIEFEKHSSKIILR